MAIYTLGVGGKVKTPVLYNARMCSAHMSFTGSSTSTILVGQSADSERMNEQFLLLTILFLTETQQQL